MTACARPAQEYAEARPIGDLAATSEGVTPMIDMEKIMDSIAKRRDALAEAWILDREAFFNALSAAGISRVNVTFDGEGDSGQIDNITAYKGDEVAPLPAQTASLRVVGWNTDAIVVEDKPIAAVLLLFKRDNVFIGFNAKYNGDELRGRQTTGAWETQAGHRE
jgi:hypothetical protein